MLANWLCLQDSRTVAARDVRGSGTWSRTRGRGKNVEKMGSERTVRPVQRLFFPAIGTHGALFFAGRLGAFGFRRLAQMVKRPMYMYSVSDPSSLDRGIFSAGQFFLTAKPQAAPLERQAQNKRCIFPSASLFDQVPLIGHPHVLLHCREFSGSRRRASSRILFPPCTLRLIDSLSSTQHQFEHLLRRPFVSSPSRHARARDAHAIGVAVR